MLIEVTEKEAKEIFSQRYIAKLGKRKYLPLAMLIAGAIVGFVCCEILSRTNEWLGVAVLAILLSPAIYFSSRLSFASKKYAKKHIEEQR